MIKEYCENCGYEKHDSPLIKEFQDGDNKTIEIEVCKHYRKQEKNELV